MSEPGASVRVVVPDEEEGERLDRFLADRCSSLSRSRIQTLIGEGVVRVGGKPRRASYRVRAADRVDMTIPAPGSLDLLPEEIPLSVAYEDDDLLVVDKAAGMTVHPAPGCRTGTLVNALLHRCRGLSGINGALRPGIVHRLDRDTTGLMVVAKNDRAHRHLAAQLEARTVSRVYAAIVWGDPGAGRIEAAIARNPRDRVRMAVREDGRRAVTRFRTCEQLAFLSLLRVELETGRTHQIRVHMEHAGHPVFGDPAYGGRSRRRGIAPGHRGAARQALDLIGRQALHASSLAFEHPSTGKAASFCSPLPEDMGRVLELLRRSP